MEVKWGPSIFTSFKVRRYFKFVKKLNASNSGLAIRTIRINYGMNADNLVIFSPSSVALL